MFLKSIISLSSEPLSEVRLHNSVLLAKFYAKNQKIDYYLVLHKKRMSYLKKTVARISQKPIMRASLEGHGACDTEALNTVLQGLKKA